MLRVDDLTVHYGRLLALNGVSLNVDSGELLVIVGPNGAGKTTLAKSIAGFVSPTSGKIPSTESFSTGCDRTSSFAAGYALPWKDIGYSPR